VFVFVQVRAKEPFTPQMLQEVEQYYFGTLLDVYCFNTRRM
jgi:hypothetical protein